MTEDMTDSSGVAEVSAGASLAALDAAVATVEEAQAEGAGADTLHLPDEVLESADITKMTDAELADFESGDPERVHAALTKQEGGPSRVSIKALKPEDRARTVQALDLIRGGTAPADAFAEVFGISALPPAVAAAVSEPVYEEEAFAQPQVGDLENHLAYLQQQYRAAKESYDPAATDLLEEMTDVKMELHEARREQAVVTQEWMGDQAESHARAMEMYGSMITDPDSSFLPYCDDEILLAEAKNDPILNEPDWPEQIGQRVMDKFFTGRAAHSPSHARGLSQIPPVPRQSVRLPGSPVGPGFSAGSLSPQTALAELDKLTSEQQDAFIQSLDHLTSRHQRHQAR